MKLRFAKVVRDVQQARDAVAARITPKGNVALEESDVIRIDRGNQQVRLFFRDRIGTIWVIVTSTTGRRQFGPVIEVDMESPEFEVVLAPVLAEVGAKLKKS